MLLLDEITSHLSHDVAVALLRKIIQSRKNKITILVSHQHLPEVNFGQVLDFNRLPVKSAYAPGILHEIH